MLREALELQVLEEDPEQAAGTVGRAVEEHGSSAVAGVLIEANAVALRRMVAITSATICGARPSDGSSIKRTRGLPISARPIASICCSPPDRSPA